MLTTHKFPNANQLSWAINYIVVIIMTIMIIIIGIITIIVIIVIITIVLSPTPSQFNQTIKQL